MTTLTFKTLCQANLLRLPTFRNSKGEIAHSEPDGSDWDLEDWMVALSGEVGELMNLMKKLRRNDFTLEEKRKDIGKELADCVIYLDILAYQIRPDDSLFPNRKDNFYSEDVFLNEIEIPKICNKMIKYLGSLSKRIDCEPEKHTYELVNSYRMLFHTINSLSRKLDIDLGQAVIDKFNKVSTRVKSPIYINDIDGVSVAEEVRFHS